jgi:tRNA pseudouridine55 synthase
LNHGILVIDKPSGPTSHDMVRLAKRALGCKVGHTGTLDPLATGVLPLLVGHATRLARFLQCEDKEYLAEITLGISTDTYDAEGRVVEENPVPNLAWEEVSELLSGFRGSIVQVPPVYSAIKIGGKKLYELARRQEEVTPPSRRVEIYRLDPVSYRPPILTVSVHCSAGTYIRSLAHDLGRRQGCGAFLSRLRRTRAGIFDLSTALPASDIATRGPDHLIPLEALLPEIPRLDLDPSIARLVRNGNRFAGAQAPGQYRLFEAGRLLAIARADGEAIQPEIVFLP